jgi:hypothetical protein
MSRKLLYAALYLLAGLLIRIRRIRMFLDLLDPDPEPLVGCTDQDPDSSHQAKKLDKP